MRALSSPVLAAALALAPAVRAGAAPSQQPAAAAPAAEEIPVDARAVVLVFDEAGGRRTGVAVELGDAVGVTDEQGRAVFTAPPGLEPLRVRLGGAAAVVAGDVRLVSGAVVDVILTLRADGSLVAADAPLADPAEVMAGDSTTRSADHDTGGARDATGLHALTILVRDSLDGSAVEGARVFLKGGPSEGGFLGATGADGRVGVRVPLGESTVSFIHPRYMARVVELKVADDASLLQVELAPASAELDEMTVRAPHIDGALSSAVAERREQKQVVEVIGADQMKRAGDGDAASALRRATGLTVVGGRYVYVRGLGDRYASTLLDGATLPSPEPEKRVVPLDMFPTGMLSGVVVQKTWSPELPGDFGGGTVLLRSRRVPERPFLDLSLGGSGMVGSTFMEAPMGPGGGLDWLGIDDGTRALPADLAAASADAPLAEKSTLLPGGYTSQQIERFGESLQRAYTPRDQLVLPSSSMQAAFGQPLALPWGELGVLGSLGYSQEAQTYSIERHTFTVGGGGALQPLDTGVISATDRSVALGGLLGVGLELTGPLAGHAIQSTTLLNRISDDETRVLEGYDRDVNADIRATRLRWVERTLLSQRLSGEHPLPFLSSRLEWRYGVALALRSEPDLRETRYDQDVSSGAFLLSDRPEGNQRLFSSLLDVGHDAEVSWRLPFSAPLAGLFPALHEDGAQGRLRTGVAFATKSREVDTRRYKLLQKGPKVSDPALRAKSAEEIFSPENIGPDGFQLAEATRKTDNYTGSATTAALWATADVPLPFRLTLSGGARVEAAHTDVTTFELFNAAATPTVATLDTVDVLPALSLTWAFARDMQLRAAGALTVSRPELRELSPAVFTDVTGGRSRYGNPALQPGSIAHLDTRFEWYLSPTDSLSVAGFAKRFTSPIETVVTAGADQAITWENADSALNLGLELEARVGLGKLHPILDDLSVGGNGALIWSQVTLPEDGIQTSRERPLEGQSPWVANVQLGWDREAWGTSATLLYNVFGPRIREVGVLGAPDVYEQPFHQLDLVVGQALPWGLSLSLKAQNLLAPPVVVTQGGEVIERVERGQTFSASLGVKL